MSDLSDDDVTASGSEDEGPVPASRPPSGPGAAPAGAGGAANGTGAPGAGGTAPGSQPGGAAAGGGGGAATAAADKEAEAALLAGEMSRDAALLQIQVNELLSEVRPAPLKGASLPGVLGQLRAALAAAPPREVPGKTLPGFISGLGLDPDDVSLAFQPPAAVEAVGSYPAGACVRSGVSVVDVAVTMPGACLHKKDHLNYKYHARRALYLAALSQALSKASTFKDQALEALHGDPARPALTVRLASPPLALRLLPVPPADAFPLHKLAPDRNNVRWVTRQAGGKQASGGGSTPAPGAAEAPAQQQQQKQAAGQQQQQQKQQTAAAGAAGQPADWLATPVYNAAILADMLAGQQAAALCSRLQGAVHLREALLLLKVWAAQVGLTAANGGSSGGGGDGGGSSSSGGSPAPLSGHLLAGVLLRAAEAAGPPAAVMSAFQLFRASLQLLADAAAWGRGLALSRAAAPGGKQQAASGGGSSGNGSGPPALGVFKKAHPVVLLDASGWLNLAAGLPPSALAQAQLLARRTLAVLDHPADPEGAFAAAFLTRLRPAALFDYVWAVGLPQQETPPLPGDAPPPRAEEAAVEALVRKALTSRASLVRALPRRLVFPAIGKGGAAAALAAGLPAPALGAPLLVGAVADAAEVSRLVDIGPAADDAAAAARFRSLWGDKAELRRFQDGKICEAVVWEAPPDARHTIPDAAVAHLLRRHLSPGAEVACSGGRLDGALATAGRPPGALGPAAAGRAAEAALDKLGKQLRALGEVVLKVVGVQPLSPAARRTAPFVPEPHPLAGGPGGLAAAAGAGGGLPRVLEPLEVMVQLEGSGRWPDDPAPYAKMKAAVGCQLATALSSSAGFRASPSEEAVDVYVDGFAFRLLLYTDRDAAMHAKAAAAGAHHVAHHHAAAHAPPRVLLLSWHHGLVATLEGQHPAYGPTVRLAQRWLGCQLLGSQLAPEALELIVGAAFCGPSPTHPPASRTSGLVRALQLLAGHPWGRAPLLVDPLREVGEAARRGLLRDYEARRAAGAAPAMFIATPRDLTASRWTLERPSAAVLAHLVAAAGAAASQLAALQERAPSAGDDWGALFATPLPDFDAWLLLRRDALPHADRALPGAAARLAKHLERSAPGGGGGGGSKRGRGGGGGDDAPASKAARAVLRAFPGRVVASQPTESLVPELLVGFDPVARYLGLLEERFGHLAVFCTDGPGGFPAVGVKWLPAAFVPAPLRPATAHAVVEVAPGLVVPNLAQVVAEMEALGQGLVQRAVVL